ncbi:hypothetical protein IGB42_03837 [Andreprevotia sp. IGB-42]|uniref:hypothetical protein n=1 Tax=Andreprevotia sp. IGB-42 TaxID=2497473 RepID=UPI001358D27C|nr:hypothetical protein [Andreprevotia sp. IGB-42]KAF0811679.1 hypothetical protein IGB42_03837 [Andreprevotia sp. IGB-42]
MNSVGEAVDDLETGDSLDDGIARFLGVSDPDEGIKLGDIRQKAASELKRYGEDLQGQLSARGITVPPAFQLRSIEGGNVGVAGDHPEKAQIEGLINADTRLLKWFKEVEVLHEILRRTELSGSEENLADQHFNLGLTSLGAIGFFTGN